MTSHVLTVGNWGGFEWALLIGVASVIVLGWYAVIKSIYFNR
jgi:hypothetical protein